MKRIISFLAAIVLSMSAIYAVESDYAGFELGAELEYSQAAGSTLEFQVGRIGGNLVMGYQFPVSDESELKTIGLFLDAGFYSVLGKKEFINSWWDMNYLVGMNLEFYIDSLFIIRPQISYGVALELLNSPAATGLFCDQMLRSGVSFLVANENLANGNLFFEAGFDYSMIFEKGDLGHYISTRLGVVYKFRNSAVATE